MQSRVSRASHALRKENNALGEALDCRCSQIKEPTPSETQAQIKPRLTIMSDQQETKATASEAVPSSTRTTGIDASTNSVSSIPALLHDDNEDDDQPVPYSSAAAPTDSSEEQQEQPQLTEADAANADNNGGGSSMYKYRDFGHVEEEDGDDATNEDTPSSTAPASSRNSAESSIRVQKFPVKLYAILAQKEFNDIICWMPHGRSWKVLKPSMFESLVMPLFFEYSNYHSFNRLVNAWSFRRISSGPDRGSYYHEVRKIYKDPRCDDSTKRFVRTYVDQRF